MPHNFPLLAGAFFPLLPEEPFGFLRCVNVVSCFWVAPNWKRGGGKTSRKIARMLPHPFLCIAHFLGFRKSPSASGGHQIGKKVKEKITLVVKNNIATYLWSMAPVIAPWLWKVALQCLLGLCGIQ